MIIKCAGIKFNYNRIVRQHEKSPCNNEAKWHVINKQLTVASAWCDECYNGVISTFIGSSLLLEITKDQYIKYVTFS